MAITHELVKRLGGSICVQSQPGIGTEFKINFPIVKLRPGMPSDHAAPPAESSPEMLPAEFDIGSPSA